MDRAQHGARLPHPRAGVAGDEGDIEELRADPSVIENLGIEDIVDHYDAIIRDFDAPPIIIGHSFGGAFTEILLDRGLGAAGVAIDAAAVRGVTKLPFSTLRSAFPALKSSANNHRAVRARWRTSTATPHQSGNVAV